MDVKDIASGLKFGETKATHSLVCPIVMALAHVPARAFWAEEDEGNDADGGEKGRSHHEAPVEADDVTGVRNFEKR
jgi:hypothetical protein